MATAFKWDELWSWYPDYGTYPDSKVVKQEIGGAVNEDWITNTCAIRLSRTFNYNGMRVPGNFDGMSTVKGGDKLRYAFRVREMRLWLTYKLRKPDFDLRKQAGVVFDKSTLSSQRGIIAFDISFADATGHLDLWDGSNFSSEYHTSRSYWDSAKRITLWETAD